VSDNNQENGQGLDVVDPANAFCRYLCDGNFSGNRPRQARSGLLLGIMISIGMIGPSRQSVLA